MRKSYWIIAAAATIMASCANEKVLNHVQSSNEQTAIGFSTFSEKSTRSVTDRNSLEFYQNTFTVYASKKSVVDGKISEVFDGKATSLCTYDDGATSPNEWTYSPYRFWDKQASYNFIAVSPNPNIVKYTWDATATPLTEVGNDDFVTVSPYVLKGQNLQKNSTQAEIFKGFVEAPNNDVDIMTSGLVPRVAGANSEVDLTFKHILSKLNVTIAKAEILNGYAVYIRDLKITGLKDKGTYAESSYVFEKDANNTITSQVSGWTPDVENTTYKLSYDYSYDTGAAAQGKALDEFDVTNNKTVPNYFIESLVMPQTVADDAVTLTLDYRIVSGSGSAAHSEDYTFEFDIQDAFGLFFDRYNYTLNFTITPTIIMFDADVADWTNESYDTTI